MLRDFFLAVGFFTRIPVPDHPNFTEAALQRSAIYFPLVGLLVGSLLMVSYWVLEFFLPTSVSVVLTLCVGFLLTGGFHEDGWADTFDGFGGAFDRDKKLAIMTDSRLGTYGSLALWGSLTLKAVTLIELLPIAGLIAWPLVHSLSRWCAMMAMVFLTYVRTNPSKAKPIVQQLSFVQWCIALIFVFPALMFLHWSVAAILFVSAITFAVLWLLICQRQIGGYTGDTLGAGQQFIELGVLLVWLCI